MIVLTFTWMNRNTYKCYNYVCCKSDIILIACYIVCDDNINRNPAYEQGNIFALVNYNAVTSINCFCSFSNVTESGIIRESSLC